MKTLTLLLTILALANCAAPKAVPVPNYQPQAVVPRAPDVSPHVEGLREATATADRASAVREDRGNRLATEAQRLKHGMTKAVQEADRLRQQQAATAADIDALWALLTEQNQIAESLFAEAEHYRAAARIESEARAEANAKLAPLQRAVSASKAELDAVRLQLIDSEQAAKNATISANSHHAEAVKAKGEADKAKGAIRVWRNIAMAMSAVSLISIAIIVFKPRFL